MVHALLAYYSVRLPKNQYPYVSMHTDYLYILTKNLTTQSAHQNYAVLPTVGNKGVFIINSFCPTETPHSTLHIKKAFALNRAVFL